MMGIRRIIQRGYVPIIPRFKHLFANGDDAKDLTWHTNGRNYDGMLYHPVDSS